MGQKVIAKKSLFEQLRDNIENKLDKFRESRYMHSQSRLMNKFHKKLKLSKNPTQEEINQKTIEYVRNAKDKQDLFQVILTDSQYSDSKFLLDLYRANPYMTIIREPGQSFVSDVDFMIEYLKCRLQWSKKFYSLESLKTLESVISRHEFTSLLKNPVFVQRLAEEFPQENIIKIIDNSRRDFYEFMQQKRVGSVYSQLPDEFFQEQVGKFGENALRYLPTKMFKNAELISRGIQHDGFSSLGYLDIESVLDNKSLVMSAFNKEGALALRNYISKTLSPHRVNHYMCHGEPHSDFSMMKDLSEVQDGLLNDSEIKQILEQLRQKELQEGKNNSTITSITMILPNSDEGMDTNN